VQAAPGGIQQLVEGDNDLARKGLDFQAPSGHILHPLGEILKCFIFGDKTHNMLRVTFYIYKVQSDVKFFLVIRRQNRELS